MGGLRCWRALEKWRKKTRRKIRLAPKRASRAPRASPLSLQLSCAEPCKKFLKVERGGRGHAKLPNCPDLRELGAAEGSLARVLTHCLVLCFANELYNDI